MTASHHVMWLCMLLASCGDSFSVSLGSNAPPSTDGGTSMEVPDAAEPEPEPEPEPNDADDDDDDDADEEGGDEEPDDEDEQGKGEESGDEP